MNIAHTQAQEPAERVRLLERRAHLWEQAIRQNLERQRAVSIGRDAAGGDAEILAALEACQRRLEREHTELSQERRAISDALLAARMEVIQAEDAA